MASAHGLKIMFKLYKNIVFLKAFICSRHWKPDRTSLPKLNQIPSNVGPIIVDGISINSSYSTDVEV